MTRLWYLADKVAQRIRDRAGFPQDGLIDVEAVANALGAIAQPAEIEEDGQLLPARDGSPVILYRADQPRQRQRFTIAHELIHLALRDATIGGAPAAAAVGASGYRSVERLCDCAAAALLMPHWWMLRTYGSAARAEQSLNLVLNVASRTNVSPAAAFLRIQGMFSWPLVLVTWGRGLRGWSTSTEVGAFSPANDVPRFAASLPDFLSRMYAEGTAREDPKMLTSAVFCDVLPVDGPRDELYLPVQVVVRGGRVPNVTALLDPRTGAASCGAHLRDNPELFSGPIPH